jgi:hypothetical protein
MIEPSAAQELFKGRHFDHEIIALCVRWYLTFKLSSRDLVQMMAERGIVLRYGNDPPENGPLRDFPLRLLLDLPRAGTPTGGQRFFRRAAGLDQPWPDDVTATALATTPSIGTATRQRHPATAADAQAG